MEPISTNTWRTYSTIYTLPTTTIDEVYLSLNSNRELGSDGSTVTVYVLTDEEYRANITAKYKELHKLCNNTDNCRCLEYGCESSFTAYPFYKRLERNIMRQLPEDITINKIEYNCPDIPKYSIILPRYTVLKPYSKGPDIGLIDTMDVNICNNIVVKVTYTDIRVTSNNRFDLGTPSITPLYVKGYKLTLTNKNTGI